MPRISLITSVACMVPMTPAMAPKTPPWEQDGMESGGGGSGKIQR